MSSSPEDEDETGELVEDGAEAESQSPSSHSSPPATTLNIYNPIQENVDKSHSQLPITIFYHNKTTNKSITLLIKYQVAADQVCPTNPSQRLIQNRRLIFVRVGRVQELITVSSPRDISLTSRVWSVLPGRGLGLTVVNEVFTIFAQSSQYFSNLLKYTLLNAKWAFKPVSPPKLGL